MRLWCARDQLPIMPAGAGLPVRPARLEGDDVAAFLRANPGWLRDNPELYRVLHPPLRLHGEALADHMAAMLERERERARAECARADSVLAAGRAAAGLAARVQDAVLALIRAADPAEFVAAELPALLAVDAARLCPEAADRRRRRRRRRRRLVPRGTVARRWAADGCRAPHADAPAARRGRAAGPGGRAGARVAAGRAAGAGLARPLPPAPGAGAAPLAFLGRPLAAACEPVTGAEAAGAFLDWLARERRASPLTVREYRPRPGGLPRLPDAASGRRARPPALAR